MMLNFEEITNNNRENAVIIHVKSTGYNRTQQIQDYDKITNFKKYRVYFWVDSDVNSLDECVILEFKRHFILQRLSCMRETDELYIECTQKRTKGTDGDDSFFPTPREGHDGGVVGVIC